MKIVALDPRRTATTQIADLHLPLAAGTDVHLFNGLLVWLADHGHIDRGFVDAHTLGFDDALQAARAGGGALADTARACGVAEVVLQSFYEMFAATPAAITAFSQGVNQSSAGTDKVNAIINCHLATGRIGKRGAGPFSVTGQPNAMGGREVGGFVNTLAAHIDLHDEPGRAAVKNFWRSPTIASKQGPKAVEMFDRIHDGRIKAVWIMATNPVVSLPDADKVKAALAGCEFVVVSDVMGNTDTAALAHVLLPALAWGEKDGTVTNSDRTISRQRAFLHPPGEARADWRIVCDVARAMGFEGFDYISPHEIFREHARLTAHANDGKRMLNLGAWDNITAAEYKNWEPAAWPMAESRESARGPMFADGRFQHPDRKARFIALTPRLPEHPTTKEFPLVLNTGRVRDHWHTMTRTGKSARLSAHMAEPYVEINTADALRFAVRNGELATLRSSWGSIVVRVRTGGGCSRRAWCSRLSTGIARSRPMRASARVDQPGGRSDLRRAGVQAHAGRRRALRGRLVWRDAQPVRRCRAPATAWWTKVQGEQFVRYELAGSNPRGLVASRRADCWAFHRPKLPRATSTGSNIAIPAGACIALPGSWTTSCRAASTSTVGRRCRNAAWLAKLFTMSKLTRRDAREPARRTRSSKAPIRARWCVRASAWAATPSPPARASSAPPPPPWKSASASSAAPTAVPACRKSRPSSARARRSRPERLHLVVFAAVTVPGGYRETAIPFSDARCSPRPPAPHPPRSSYLWPERRAGRHGGRRRRNRAPSTSRAITSSPTCIGRRSRSIYRQKHTGVSVIVVPGGGHRELWTDHEGHNIARFLNERGIAAFVL